MQYKGRVVKRVFLRAMLILGVLSAALLASAQSVGSWDSAAEQQILRLVNQERTQRGLRPLQMEPRLITIARRHSERMAREDTLTHRFPGEPDLTARLAPAGLHFDVSGENVAVNMSAVEAHHGLMGSPPHRENILSPRYNVIGIGVVRVGPHVWVTQDFMDRLPDTSALDAAEQIARQFNEMRRSARSKPLPVIANGRLHDLACDMARHDSISPAKASALPNVARVVTFTVSNLLQMPSHLQGMKTDAASGFSVGACYASSSTYTVPVYWVIVATYF